jgi:2-keto-3-deoxy-L-rhamnonate aldolase RhmA
MEVVERYEEASRRHERPLATMCYSTEDARRWVEKGYRFLIHTADVNILYQAYAAWRTGMGGAGDG